MIMSAIAFSCPAKIYKWVDKEGNTHFSDKPPKDKGLKATQQKLDNMNIVDMPRPLKTQALSSSMCRQAVDNFSKNFATHKKKIEQELAQSKINDMQFAEKLTELETLKKRITVKNCHKADPKLNTLLHCMAKNPNTQVCR
ncbi:hypothetical protein GCM10009123_10280 [Kangiella japonica]|uniref:DUF4124 domain-containing protein n=2 Tax=Kangiella japonica TaxID=647384 RepID=A0ABN0SXA1_9GAMM